MREIKFRAWNLLLQEMYRPKQNTFLSSGVYASKTSIEYLNNILYDPDYVPMQYTGLKDRYGCEIYEGDVLVMNCDDRSVIFSIEWDNEVACHNLVTYSRNKKTASMALNTIQEAPKKTNKNFTELIQVMGNIYENPEYGFYQPPKIT